MGKAGSGRGILYPPQYDWSGTAGDWPNSRKRRGGRQRNRGGVHYGFDHPGLGNRAFDYWLESGLTTHTPDVERIQAAAGLAGAALTGAPSNLEPRLVTQDGAPCAFVPNPEDAVRQRLYDANTATSYAAYETVYSLGVTPWALYALIRPIIVFNGYWMGCMASGSQKGFFLRDNTASNQLNFRIGNGTSEIVSLIATSAAVANTWHHVCVRWNGSGAATPTLEMLKNNSVIASATGLSAGGTGAPTTNFSLMAVNSSNTEVSGHGSRFQLYTGVDHSQNNLTGQHYSLSKTIYPGFSLP